MSKDLTRDELMAVILQQREMYGEALQRLGDLLIAAGLKEFGAIALRIKENYGLDDRFGVDWIALRGALTETDDKMETDICRQLATGVWTGSVDLKEGVTNFSEGKFKRAIRRLVTRGLIISRGPGNNREYRLAVVAVGRVS